MNAVKRVEMHEIVRREGTSWDSEGTTERTCRNADYAEGYGGVLDGEKRFSPYVKEGKPLWKE